MSNAAVVSTSSTDTAGGVRLRLLDGFDLRRNGIPVELPLAAQRLLAFLALHDRSLTRIHVAGVLWLDASEERSRANLRATLWRLRRPSVPLVETSSTHVSLDRAVAVDVNSLVAAAQRMLRGADVDADAEAAADADANRDERGTDADEALLCGDLLPGWYDEWVLEERERLRQLQLHALEVLAERLVAENRYGQAVEAALAALRAQPLRESSERLLIRIYLAEGNYGEALRRFLGYHRRLRDEFGLEPSPQMTELVAGLAPTLPREDRRQRAARSTRGTDPIQRAL